MIRGEGGRLYDIFRDRSIAAIGWSEIAGEVSAGMTKSEIRTLYAHKRPELKRGTVIAGAAQVWRFLNEIEIGDEVVTYSPDNRTYLLGIVTSDATYAEASAADGVALVRKVDWRPIEVERDHLPTKARNSLGSTLTVFVVPEQAAASIRAIAESSGIPAQTQPVVKGELEEEEEDEDLEGAAGAGSPTTLLTDPLLGIEVTALERIKDVVAKLDWEEMQDLVAGILRAMGYKTLVSPPGPDRGKDIVASPDGFGFEHPRIVVEVKHRNGQMDSKAIRSFLGGRHQDDRGLYVSTGGFSRDAFYEADRAAVPLTLWTMDTLVRALIEHYERTDAETKRLVPLKRMYVPA